ncbi:hypothetical protein H5410_061952 [Solanum commersonii]|uniref:DUF7746 domain-containing protein n=1 Tax=Solanum commersonii TaxID=4109 RepID=A0A9J5W9F6_SOLCO|nr:hypothetical protein H5410_061952 [Solanum commersonii]
MKKGLISKLEAIAIYMEEVKRFMKNLDIDIRDDISMASASHTNDDEESCMAGEAQTTNSNEEIDIDTLLQRLQVRLFFLSSQDVLLEEHEHTITNSYNGKEFYEWSIDGYTDRQIYTTVHKMFMYSTICKANKNSDKTIIDMITVGFTGQLKGWWDNYLNTEQRDKILQAVKQEGEWSDNSETNRTMLQNLRCKTLTSFRFYKDLFHSRFMKLPECNSSHWKSKFIDGLPALFAERVRKTLRGDSHSINYDSYTYGKLVSACIQEGLALCNEIKLNQQIKRHSLNERPQLGEFCEQFALDIPKATSKDKKHSSKNIIF